MSRVSVLQGEEAVIWKDWLSHFKVHVLVQYKTFFCAGFFCQDCMMRGPEFGTSQLKIVKNVLRRARRDQPQDYYTLYKELKEYDMGCYLVVELASSHSHTAVPSSRSSTVY
jgi:hypothetical protein